MRVFRNLALFAAAAALTLSAAACSDSDDDGSAGAPNLSNAVETGTELATKYIQLLHDGDVEGLQEFLSDAFIIQRANGSHATKDDYLRILPEINDFQITDVSAKQAGAALAVRWTLEVDESIDGQKFATEPAPRLSTFVWNGEAWQLLSHANFNTPPAN